MFCLTEIKTVTRSCFPYLWPEMTNQWLMNIYLRESPNVPPPRRWLCHQQKRKLTKIIWGQNGDRVFLLLLNVTYFLRKASKMFSLLFTLLLIFSFLAQSDGKWFSVPDIIKFRRLSLGNRWLMKIIFKEFVYHPSTMKIGWKNNEVLHFCKDVGSIKAE